MLLGMKWTGWHRTAWSAAGRGSLFGRRNSRRAFRVTMTVAPVSARMVSQRSVAPIRVVTRKIASRPRAKATFWRMLATVARDRDRDVADTGQPQQGGFDLGDATWTVHTVHPVAQTLPAGAVHHIHGRAVLHHPLHPCRSGSCPPALIDHASSSNWRIKTELPETPEFCCSGRQGAGSRGVTAFLKSSNGRTPL